MSYSVWHHRTQAGEQSLQQDQPGIALVHYLAALEQARYWMEGMTEQTPEAKRAEMITIYLRSCLNLFRFWYIQSSEEEQLRYLQLALNYSCYFDELSLQSQITLNNVLQTLRQSLEQFIREQKDQAIESLKQSLKQLEDDIEQTTDQINVRG
ncbi:DUF2753 family protein [Celerinatantimonas diazotrophica]|uniref:Uncharacterized protein DUF2753 n=1 Tax=Celerinatantimonas diazotrophica TaxID=412034 RepID=A0A4R1JA31_9GAMM|nr:DUF2753 family protein [Celerinatantimonas diazotrophica]TCK47317.1 uncharacterized protein DUF2753 [Celerinatantimonas diazotrophica]CAG9295067.1 hypothetical protein CEDIAZO_00173 [Celerinatantimonas diazotrophica]